MKIRNALSFHSITIISIAIAGVGKVFGLLRELLLAGYYGASVYTDAYVMSTMVPLIIMGFVQSFTVVFTPIYINAKTNKGINVSDDYFKQLLVILIAVSGIMIIMVELFCPNIVEIVAPGFDDETTNITIIFVRISIFTGLTSAIVELCLAFLRCNDKYLFASSICLIVSPIECFFIVLGAKTQRWLLVLGPVVAQVIQVIISILMIELILQNRKDYSHKAMFLKDEIIHSFSMVIPIFLGSMASQISTYVDKMFASNLPLGTVSSLNYAEKTYTMINTLIFLTISTVLFPNISQLCQEGDKTNLKSHLRRLIEVVIILGVIITVISILFGEDIITALFKRGSFTSELAKSTSYSFSLYMIGFTALGIHEMLSRVFYGLDKSKSEMIIGFMIVLVNIVLDYVLVGRLGQPGLPLATSISLLSSIPINYIYLRKEIGKVHINVYIIAFLKCIFASVIGFGTTKVGAHLLGLSNVYFKLPICIILGSVFTIVILKMIGLREIDLLNEALKRSMKGINR